MKFKKKHININYSNKELFNNVVITDENIEQLGLAAVFRGELTKAIWDSGSTRSIISPILVDKLNLKPLAKSGAYIKSGPNVYTSNLYKINITFISSRVYLSDIICAAVPFPGAGICIGLDVISMGELIIKNKGKKFYSKYFKRIKQSFEVDTYCTGHLA